MTNSTRRGVLGGIVGVASAASCLLTGPAFAQALVKVPTGPMRLSRRLVRGLSDGASITVDRTWTIDFAQRSGAISITGSQVSARVDAPAKLAPIARIEETRSTDTMWPIRLSGAGTIIAAGVYTSREDIAAAVHEGRAIIAAGGGSQTYKAQRLHYLAQLEQAGGSLLEKLPPDLFFPEGGERETVQSVELPGGLNGEFVVAYASEAAKEGGWLASSERRIITRIGRDERRSSDSWRLDPA